MGLDRMGGNGAMTVKHKKIIGRLILVALASVAVFGGNNVAAEERSATAIASWEGNGQVFQVAPDKAYFLGSLAGTIFVQDGDGTLNAGEVVCPGTFDISLSTREQAGRGHCIITALDGGGQNFGVPFELPFVQRLQYLE